MVGHPAIDRLRPFLREREMIWLQVSTDDPEDTVAYIVPKDEASFQNLSLSLGIDCFWYFFHGRLHFL